MFASLRTPLEHTHIGHPKRGTCEMQKSNDIHHTPSVRRRRTTFCQMPPPQSSQKRIVPNGVRFRRKSAAARARAKFYGLAENMCARGCRRDGRTADTLPTDSASEHQQRTHYILQREMWDVRCDARGSRYAANNGFVVANNRRAKRFIMHTYRKCFFFMLILGWLLF